MSVLPEAVPRLKGESQIADLGPLRRGVFCDLRALPPMPPMEAEEVVEMLQETFRIMEEACFRNRVEKIKTIGDASAVSGVSIEVRIRRGHCGFCAGRLHSAEGTLRVQRPSAGFRMGIHSGPCSRAVGSALFRHLGRHRQRGESLQEPREKWQVRCSNELRDRLGDCQFSRLRRNALKERGTACVGASRRKQALEQVA